MKPRGTNKAGYYEAVIVFNSKGWVRTRNFYMTSKSKPSVRERVLDELSGEIDDGTQYIFTRVEKLKMNKNWKPTEDYDRKG